MASSPPAERGHESFPEALLQPTEPSASISASSAASSGSALGPTAANLAVLRAWFEAQAGSMLPSLALTAPDAGSHGSHVRISPASPPIPPLTPLVRAPFTTTLSALSVPQIAPFWPLTFLDAWVGQPQVLVRFLVMEALLQGPRSVWWPYLRTVPQPGKAGCEEPFDTPLYWNEADMRWLQGTRLAVARQEREVRWRAEWAEGMAHFRARAPTDARAWTAVQPQMWAGYSWDLYLWATTLLTSRAFPSSLLVGWQPAWDDASDWGRCGIARAWRAKPSAGPRFPVLFPVLDLANHDPRAKVEWDVDGSALTLVSHDVLRGGRELCNNYGPKSNDELMLGYGFLLDDNEDDTVTISAVTRSPAAVTTASTEPAGVSREAVLSETRGLRRSLPDERENSIISILRGALSLTQAHDLAMQLANQREQPGLASADNVAAFFPAGITRNVSCMADRTILGLRDFVDRLERDAPDAKPANHRQRMAAAFRSGQIEIVEANLERLEEYLVGLQKEGYIVTLSQILNDAKVAPDAIRQPLRAILEHGCGVKPKSRQVTERGLLEFAFVVWFRLIWAHHALLEGSQPQRDGWSKPLTEWTQFIERLYGPVLRDPPTGVPKDARFADGAADASKYLEIVTGYAVDESQPHAEVFGNPAWTLQLAQIAVYIFRQESVVFESMHRQVFNGAEEVHEPLLFLERPEQSR